MKGQRIEVTERNARILAVLAKYPLTAAQVGARFGMSRRSAEVQLRRFLLTGQVTKAAHEDGVVFRAKVAA